MSKSVLLIEKHTATRSMLRFALELQGCRVIEAGNLSDIPAALATVTPALLVIGIASPQDGDSELIQALRRHPGLDRLPALLVGEEQYEVLWDLRAVGNCAWLNKPFRMREFSGLLENLLGAEALPESRFDQRLPLGIRND